MDKSIAVSLFAAEAARLRRFDADIGATARMDGGDGNWYADDEDVWKQWTYC